MRHSFLLVSLFACASIAQAQVGEISVSGGGAHFKAGSLGTVGSAPDSGTISVDGGFHLDIRLTLNTFRFFGHEFGYGYSRSTFHFPDTTGLFGGTQDISIPVHQGYYDFLVYATPEGTRIRPFATGGIGFSSFFPPGSSAYYGNQITKFGVNYGVGIKVRVTSIIGIRFDVRQYNTSQPFEYPNQSGRYLQTAFTGGASFNF